MSTFGLGPAARLPRARAGQTRPAFPRKRPRNCVRSLRRLAAQVPELAAAQRTLDRTQRLHGWETAFDATVVATSICIEPRIGTVHQPLWVRWERRLSCSRKVVEDFFCNVV
jgi:hypothetical protein